MQNNSLYDNDIKKHKKRSPFTSLNRVVFEVENSGKK